MNRKEERYCYRYPHPAVTTDCVIFGFDGVRLHVLLIERGIPPFKGEWAIPGGFLKIDESAAEGALRELREETGLRPEYIEQFHTYSAPERDPRERVITIAYLALVKLQEVRGGDDARKAEWFPIDSLPGLAFDHADILHDALNRLRERIYFYPIGFDLLPEKFTIPQLQTLYEVILGTSFDRRNFAKKLHHLQLVTPLDETTRTTPGRDARLYQFNRDKYKDMKRDFNRFEF